MISADDLVQSPAWFPLEVMPQPAVMRLLYLDEAAYRGASFLDQRLLTQASRQTTCELQTVRSAAAKLRPRAHYIFHIGHVGSTLVARLVGEHERLFCMREPALLRALAADRSMLQVPQSLEVALSLFARTWRPDQRTVIKVTSTVSELAASILGGADQPAGIFMFAHPLAYLRGILGGPNSRVEARTLAPARQRRLLTRLGPGDWQPDPRSEGELIAMSWLCEMVTLQQAATQFPARVLWVDFDAFLAAPLPGLQSILVTLGETSPPSDLEKLVAGPLMRQYSKAPEYAYDAALRRDVLRSADWEHPQAITQGMEWLGRVGRQFPLAAQAIETAARVNRA